jgi:uncharacterized protein YegL
MEDLMTDQNYTHATLVVDTSSSMSSVQKEAQTAINQFFADQRAAEGSLSISLIQFSSGLREVHTFKDIKEVPEFELKPGGWTALFDAVGHAITATGKQLAALPEDRRPANVLIAIITDGEENASQRYNLSQLKEMIETQQSVYSWHFSFLGADASSWQGEAMGVANVTKYKNENQAGMYHSFSQSTSSLRATGAYSMPDNV